MTTPARAHDQIFSRKDPHPERAVRRSAGQARLQMALDEALAETFPASDPLAVTQATTVGAGKGRPPKAT